MTTHLALVYSLLLPFPVAADGGKAVQPLVQQEDGGEI